MSPARIETERLILRHWLDADSEPFAELNADPRVMEYFPAPLTRTQSDDLIDRIAAAFVSHGFGLWALELKATGTFIGFTGLTVPAFDAPFTPTVEVGWRLAWEAWGKGLATEAAQAALRSGFVEHGLPEVVSLTYEQNVRSRAVMQRLGMVRDPIDDFDHPSLAGHRLAPHVLYRMSADRWATGDR